MRPQEQLKLMIDRIAKRGADDEILLELERLLVAFDHDATGDLAGYRLNIQEAIDYAEMLFGLRETTHDPDLVRGFLIQHLGTAAEIARELDRGSS